MKLLVYILCVWGLGFWDAEFLNFGPCTTQVHPKLSPLGRDEPPGVVCLFTKKGQDVKYKARFLQVTSQFQSNVAIFSDVDFRQS